MHNLFKKAMIDAQLALGTPKAMLLTSTHTTDIDTQEFIDDVSANESSGTGYTAGGQALASVTTTLNTGTDTVPLDCADISWATTTISDFRYMAIYVDTGTPATSRIMTIVDFGGTETRTAENIDVTINASGLFSIA